MLACFDTANAAFPFSHMFLFYSNHFQYFYRPDTQSTHAFTDQTLNPSENESSKVYHKVVRQLDRSSSDKHRFKAKLVVDDPRIRYGSMENTKNVRNTLLDGAPVKRSLNFAECRRRAAV